MSYKNWNDDLELKCFLIYKYLEMNKFPRGKQTELSKNLASETNLSYGSISAKISNFKSLAKINNHSNASKNSERIYMKYIDCELSELYKIANYYI